MNKLFLALAVLALTGCATCREHPALCAAGAAIAVTSLALSAHRGAKSEEVGRIGPPLEPNCQKLPEMCK